MQTANQWQADNNCVSDIQALVQSEGKFKAGASDFYLECADPPALWSAATWRSAE